MPRPPIDLTPHHADIQAWMSEGANHAEIRTRLASKGTHISLEALGVKLRKAGFHRYLNHKLHVREPTGDISALRARIRAMFGEVGGTIIDKDMTATLRGEGFNVTEQVVARVRRDMELYKSYDRTSAEVADREFYRILREEIEKGRIVKIEREDQDPC